jgi:hypothetical protein
MPYFLILALFVIFSPISKRNETKCFLIFSYFMLLSFACIRFGIGTDYFNYYSIYSHLPINLSYFSILKILVLRIEPGFAFLGLLFKSLNIPFTYFVAFCAFVSLSLIIYTIQHYSINKTFSLLIFFANYYLVYIENLLRQGIALAIFIYAFYDFIFHKNRVKYYFLIFLGMLFHVSIIISFFIPIVVRINSNLLINPLNIIIVIIISLISSLFVPKIIKYVLSIFTDRASGYLNQNIKFNIFPISLRLLEMIIIYKILKKKYILLCEYEIISIKSYFFGILVYFSFSSISIFSRLTEYFMFIEIILIPNLLLYLGKKERKIYQTIFYLIFIMLFFKDINANIHQREFKSKRIIDYQYITIFNKDRIEDMLQKNNYIKFW